MPKRGVATLGSRALLVAAVVSVGIGCGRPPEASSARGPARASRAPRAATAPSHAEPSLVATDTGALRGKRVGDVYAYLGIPYAAPPVGPLRWKPPQPVMPWPSPRDAIAFGPACPQLAFDGGFDGGSEDCLTLNVWAPASRPASPVPVIVYVHGGYNVRGKASGERDGALVLDGQYIAEHGPAVVVTIQYRLGNLGFLAHRALAAESPGRNVGNYGLLDQIAALEWVQRNIRAFGGDPSRVLLEGYSAGSIDTCSLLVSPLAKGLFTRASMHSWPCVAQPLATMERHADRYATTLGCADAASVTSCMRDKSVADIVEAGPAFGVAGSMPHGPTIDGYVLTADPLETIAARKHNHMPIIVGMTSAEYESLLAHDENAAVRSESDYRVAVQKMFLAAKAAAVLAEYPVTAFASPREALIELESDLRIVCPSKRILRLLASSQSEPVRAYVFAHAFAAPGFKRAPHGHGVDGPFYFHTIATRSFTPSPSELALANSIVGYYYRFAETGDPNGDGSVRWPAYDRDDDDYLVLDAPIAAINGFHASRCALFERLGR